MNFAPGTSQQYSHTDNGVLGQRGTKQSMKALYDKNIYGPMGMKDMRFPVDQDIQGPVLHAVTTDRKVYEDCTYWNPSLGFYAGAAYVQHPDLGKWARSSNRTFWFSGAFREQIAPGSVGKGKNRSNLYFAYGFVVANG